MRTTGSSHPLKPDEKEESRRARAQGRFPERTQRPQCGHGGMLAAPAVGYPQCLRPHKRGKDALTPRHSGAGAAAAQLGGGAAAVTGSGLCGRLPLPCAPRQVSGFVNCCRHALAACWLWSIRHAPVRNPPDRTTVSHIRHISQIQPSIDAASSSFHRQHDLEQQSPQQLALEAALGRQGGGGGAFMHNDSGDDSAGGSGPALWKALGHNSSNSLAASDFAMAKLVAAEPDGLECNTCWQLSPAAAKAVAVNDTVILTVSQQVDQESCHRPESEQGLLMSPSKLDPESGSPHADLTQLSVRGCASTCT